MRRYKGRKRIVESPQYMKLREVPTPWSAFCDYVEDTLDKEFYTIPNYSIMSLDNKNYRVQILDGLNESDRQFAIDSVVNALKERGLTVQTNKYNDIFVPLDEIQKVFAVDINESYKRKSLKEDYNDQPEFKAFITNLGKYNEGELVGEWVEFPIDEDAFDAVLKRIGIGEPNEFGDVYEEWFVTDYDCNLNGFDWEELGEYPSYDTLQQYGELIENITDAEAINNIYEYTQDLEEAIDGYENGSYYYYPGVNTDSDLGYYYVDEMYGGIDQLDLDTIERHFDYEALGRELDFDMYGEDDELTAGEYWCGDENASHTEIGEEFVAEVGIEGVANPENYFDYENFGQDIRLSTNGMFTSNGYVEAV